MSFHFITFADGDWHMRRAGQRILREARNSGFFQSVHLANLDTLRQSSPDFWTTHASYINASENSPGLGNFIWKPFIVNRLIRNIPLGDSVVYLDAGCHLNFKNFVATNRFKDYCKMTIDKGSVVTQLKSQSFGIADLREITWTSPKLIEALKMSVEQQESNQIQAGVLFLQSNESNRALTNEWLRLAIVDGYRFLEKDDWVDVEGKVCTSRFDQSIFSCLAKKAGLNAIPDETYFYPNWNSAGSNFPIWAMRRRNGVDVEKFKLQDLTEISLLFGTKVLRKLGMRFN